MLFALLGVENWSSLGVVLEHDWWARTAWAVRETLTEEATPRGPGGPKRISLSKIRISVLLSSYPLLYFKSSFTWMTSHYTQSTCLFMPHFSSRNENGSCARVYTTTLFSLHSSMGHMLPTLLSKESIYILLTLLKHSSCLQLFFFPNTDLKAIYL